MSVKCIPGLYALIFLTFFRGALSIRRERTKGYYTILAPSNVRQDSVFHVSFTLNKFHKSCWFNVSLKAYDHKEYEISLKEGIEVRPGTTKLVELHTPSFIRPAYGYLKFIGYRGIIKEEEEKIDFQPDKYFTFIQTNKHKYKPGELVQFRVIFIDQIKRPALVREIINILIFDHEDNLIWKITDVKLVQGVFRSDFQLSDSPVLGQWLIKVETDDRNLAEKNFEVDRYELPKFKVKITTKEKVSFEEQQIVLEIHASYFYGEPVKGSLSISIINTDVPYPHKHTLPTFTKEIIQIDGKTTININFQSDLHLDIKKEDKRSFFISSPYKFKIEATVIDVLSEEQSYAATTIEVHKTPYKIKIENPSGLFNSDPILNIEVKVSIEDLERNSIQDTKGPIEIIVQCHEDEYHYDENDFDMFRIEYKKQIGKDFAVINVTNKNYAQCALYAEYQGSRSHKIWMYENLLPLKLDILTDSPEEGKNLEIQITSPEPIEEFSYEIESKRDIIQSNHVNVFGNQTTYILRLDVTILMVPKIKIYVHHIRNMRFRGVFMGIGIKRAFHKSIEIETENEAKPGALVNINVTTDDGSYVGLMGLDQSAPESINILNGDSVNTKLETETRVHYPHPRQFSGGIAGDIIVLSNVFPAIRRPSAGGGGPVPPRTRTRKLFPESWLYIDVEKTPAGGLNIWETVPDTITTWAITGFSVHPDSGLTFTKNTTYLRVFQEFFVSMDFPSLVREGEIIEVPVYISNYMKQDALANVTIETDSENLVILEHAEAISKSNHNASKLISAKERTKLLVFLKPLKQGHYNVTVKAISPVASDAVQKTLHVQSQGIPYAMSKTYLVHLPEESVQEDEITIDIPEDAVPGSQRVEVSVVGDIFRPLMTKLQKIARVPYGNGEENMRLIVSNSIVLKYLKTLNYSNPSLENKIRFNLQLGYQNQLSFKYLDGSFGLVERRTERTGEVWQTILALWGLNLAKDFTHVDPKVIERGLNYLKSKQQANGCYKSESGLEEDVKFTAFGLMVFLMDEHSITTYRKVIVKGLEYLFDTADDLEYSPISIMAGYVLLLGKHDKVENYLTELNFNSSSTRKQVQWTKSDTLESHLETTAESLMNLFEYQEIPERSLLHIVRGLVFPKRGESSVTHMVALQAMIRFVEKLLLKRKNLNLTLNDDTMKKPRVFEVNGKNSQVSQIFEVSQSSRKINIQSKGYGFAVVDVKYKYNLVPENQSSSIYNTNILSRRTSNNLGTLKICLGVRKIVSKKTSIPAGRIKQILTNNTVNKFTVMEVNIESGYIFTEEEYRLVEKLSEEIKSIQVSTTREKVIIYFNNTSSDNTCIELEVRKTHKVFNSKPGWVVVYDPHNRDEKTAKGFHISGF